MPEVPANPATPSSAAPSPATPGRGYPLSALFLLVTASGVVLAMVTPVFRGPQEAGWTELLIASIAGGGLLSLVGLLLGLFHYSRWRGVLSGGLLGAVLGLLLGPLIFASPSSLPLVLLSSLGGAVVIVAVAAVARLTSAPPPAVGNPFHSLESTATRSPETKQPEA
jgi:peptidoglycan/LPS O-acetylase OafA/YrhL